MNKREFLKKINDTKTKKEINIDLGFNEILEFNFSKKNLKDLQDFLKKQLKIDFVEKALKLVNNKKFDKNIAVNFKKDENNCLIFGDYYISSIVFTRNFEKISFIFNDKRFFCNECNPLKKYNFFEECRSCNPFNKLYCFEIFDCRYLLINDI